MNTTVPTSTLVSYKVWRQSIMLSKLMREDSTLTLRLSTIPTKHWWTEMLILSLKWKPFKSTQFFWLNKTRTCKRNWIPLSRLMTLLEETLIEKKRCLTLGPLWTQLSLNLTLWFSKQELLPNLSITSHSNKREFKASRELLVVRELPIAVPKLEDPQMLSSRDPQLSLVDLKEEEPSSLIAESEWLNKDKSKDNSQIEEDIKLSQGSKQGPSSMSKENKDNTTQSANHHTWERSSNNMSEVDKSKFNTSEEAKSDHT